MCVLGQNLHHKTNYTYSIKIMFFLWKGHFLKYIYICMNFELLLCGLFIEHRLLLGPFIHWWMRVNTMLPIVLPMWNSINIFSNEKQNQAPFSISIRFYILHLFVYICKLKHFTSYTVKCISSVLQRTFCSIRAKSECIISFNCYFFIELYIKFREDITVCFDLIRS